MSKPNGMNQEEQNQYIQRLLRGGVMPGSELEAATLGQLKGLSNNVAQKKLRYDAMSEEVVLLESEIKRLNGQREAYITILIIAETQRRLLAQAEKEMRNMGSAERKPEANPQPPLSLEELAQKLDVDKIEAVNKDGELQERVVRSIKQGGESKE